MLPERQGRSPACCGEDTPAPLHRAGESVTHNAGMRRFPLPIAVVLALVGSLLVGQVPSAPPAAANAPDRVLSGWMPYWMTSPGRPTGVDSAVANADLFEDVSPFWYSATARRGGGIKVTLNRNFTNGEANAAWAMQRLREAGLVVLPAIADASGKRRMAQTLADPALRGQHVADLVALAVNNGYDGLDLDYENFAFSDGRSSWESTRPNWTTFVAELGAALRAQGKLLSVTIPGPCSVSNNCGGRNGYWVYNLEGIAPHADRVRIMAYDYTVQSVGPIAPMDWVRANVEYAVTVMDPAKLQIGVPTYGRARTRTKGGDFRLSGVCPSKNGSAAERRAYRSATSMAAVTAANIPGLLETYGLTDADVRWDPVRQESSFRYTKDVDWTDSSGTRQTCRAARQVNFVGPDGVLARTQLVGEYGLNAAALWTIGGENPAQWSVLRSYAQSLAPAEAAVAIDATPAVVVGQPTSVAGGVTFNGAGVPDVPVTLEFQPVGASDWQALQSGASAADGSVSFQVVLPSSGRIRLTTAAVGPIAASQSGAFDVAVGASVTAKLKTKKKVGSRDRIRVRAIVRPAQADQKVVLQVLKKGTWRKVKVARTNAKGRVTIKAQAQKAKKRWTYRVISRRAGGISPGISQEFTIRVR